jgi:hypothetical protein
MLKMWNDSTRLVFAPITKGIYGVVVGGAIGWDLRLLFFRPKKGTNHPFFGSKKS